MRWSCCLVTASTSAASAVDALDDLVLLELLARHATDACAVEVGLLGLDASETAELEESSQRLEGRESCEDVGYLFVALLLPLRDQVLVGIIVLQQPLVKLLGDGFFLVVEVVDVFGAWWTKSAGVADRVTVAQASVSSNGPRN
jgi:hypothetical protein